LKKCGEKKKNPGRPKKRQVEEEEDNSYDVSSEEETAIVPPQKKNKRVVSDNSDLEMTFDKAMRMRMIGHKADVLIRNAIEFDPVFETIATNSEAKNERLREILVQKKKTLEDPLRFLKSILDNDFQNRASDFQDRMRPLLNPTYTGDNIESGCTTEKLEKQKKELENELFYVTYAITLREMTPKYLTCELMESLIPVKEDKTTYLTTSPFATESQHDDYNMT
jgi:hypothetical protein